MAFPDPAQPAALSSRTAVPRTPSQPLWRFCRPLPSSCRGVTLPRHGHQNTTSRPLPRHKNRSRLLLWFRRDQGLLLPKEPSAPAPPRPKVLLPAVGPQGRGPSMHGCPQTRAGPGEHWDTFGTAGHLWDTGCRLRLRRARCARAGAGTGQGQLPPSECGGTRSAFKRLVLARLAREWASSWRQASGAGTGGTVLPSPVSPGSSLWGQSQGIRH